MTKTFETKNELIFSLFTKASNESLISLGLVQRLLNWKLLALLRRKWRFSRRILTNMTNMFYTISEKAINVFSRVRYYELSYEWKCDYFVGFRNCVMLNCYVFQLSISNLHSRNSCETMFCKCYCNENCFTWECGKHKSFH